MRDLVDVWFLSKVQDPVSIWDVLKLTRPQQYIKTPDLYSYSTKIDTSTNTCFLSWGPASFIYRSLVDSKPGDSCEASACVVTTRTTALRTTPGTWVGVCPLWWCWCLEAIRNLPANKGYALCDILKWLANNWGLLFCRRHVDIWPECFGYLLYWTGVNVRETARTPCYARDASGRHVHVSGTCTHCWCYGTSWTHHSQMTFDKLTLRHVCMFGIFYTLVPATFWNRVNRVCRLCFPNFATCCKMACNHRNGRITQCPPGCWAGQSLGQHRLWKDWDGAATRFRIEETWNDKPIAWRN